jgi:hypothetical protein
MLNGVTEGTLMSKINLARVLRGGLLAGLVINVGELILNSMVLASEWAEFLEQLGLDPTFSAPQLVAGAIITFIYGIVLVWIYAAIRPRFGPGPRTAVIAGLTVLERVKDLPGPLRRVNRAAQARVKGCRKGTAQ